MKKELNNTTPHSLWKMAWFRLKKNKLSMLGLYVIAAAFIIAILGPIIRPDATPYANHQLLEIATKPPGFSVQLLHIKKNRTLKELHFWDYFTRGVENDFVAIPIHSHHFEGSNLMVEKYTGGTPNNGPILKYNLADVVYPLGANKKINTTNGSLEFYTIDKERIQVSSKELVKTIKNQHIISKTYYLGTDKYGRDLLSRLMAGTWVSLFVGFISVFISVVIGITLGALSGYYRGKLDHFIVWFINVVWSIPTLLLVIAITLALGKGTWQVFVAVGLTMWVEVARVVRGQMLGLREKEFVEAGKALGFTNFRIIFKHIIPNLLGPVIVISAINFAAAILIEAGLSFLGYGAQPPQATWGKIIAEHKGYLITGKAYLAVLPGIAITLMVLAFVLIGNGLRDALDAKSIDDVAAV